MRNTTDEQREPTRRALGALLVPVFFVVLFSACIIGTYHKPHPNDIKIGIVGPAPLTAPLRAELAKRAGPAFDIQQSNTPADAVRAVRQRDLDAAFVPTPNPAQPATLIVATAGGRIVATAAETLARAVTTTQGAQLVVRDVRPLASGDEIGLGIFLFMLICTISGYLAATVLFTAAPTLAEGRRYAMLASIAILTPTIVYLIGGLGFGTYTGSVGTILAFIGVGALYTFVVAVITRWLQVLLGPAGIFVSLAIFVFLNIPSFGATYTSTMLPSFWRFVNQFWLGAQTVNAERSLLYFGGSGVGTDLLKLFAWTGAVLVLLAVPLVWKLTRQREPSVAGEFAPAT
jgi:hypothetical protein